MLGLDIGDGRNNCRYHRARYKLLERRVYDLRVSCNFLEMGNCFKKLVYVCGPERVVKTRGNRCYYSCFFFKTLRRGGFIGSVAATQLTSSCKVELMQEALLLFVLH